MNVPDWLALMASLGVNVEDVKARWIAWQKAHPGESAPLSEIAGELFNGLDDGKIVAICTDAAKQLIEFVTKATTPVSQGDDPSVMA